MGYPHPEEGGGRVDLLWRTGGSFLTQILGSIKQPHSENVTFQIYCASHAFCTVICNCAFVFLVLNIDNSISPNWSNDLRGKPTTNLLKSSAPGFACQRLKFNHKWLGKGQADRHDLAGGAHDHNHLAGGAYDHDKNLHFLILKGLHGQQDYTLEEVMHA